VRSTFAHQRLIRAMAQFMPIYHTQWAGPIAEVAVSTATPPARSSQLEKHSSPTAASDAIQGVHSGVIIDFVVALIELRERTQESLKT
jgi:hypothetical protein